MNKFANYELYDEEALVWYDYMLGLIDVDMTENDLVEIEDRFGEDELPF